MPQTVLITGASSGIGRATADVFHSKGWNVVATMRAPSDAGDLAGRASTLVTRLDVMDLASIDSAVRTGLDRFGQIDVLVNNAGLAVVGPFEAIPRDEVMRQFNTNLFGLLDVTRAMLPHFRAQKSGMIVNVSSIAGRASIPMNAMYIGSKFAVEGISEALKFELDGIGVGIKVVEPGATDSDMGKQVSGALDFHNDERLTEYQDAVAKVKGFFDHMLLNPAMMAPGSLVAEAIFTAATDGTPQLRYVVGEDAKGMWQGRSALDDEAYFEMMKGQFGL